jgi:hypothetical protein
MPTVIRFDGLRVVIYTDDHRPPHVHVIGRGCEAIFQLAGPATPPVLRENSMQRLVPTGPDQIGCSSASSMRREQLDDDGIRRRLRVTRLPDFWGNQEAVKEFEETFFASLALLLRRTGNVPLIAGVFRDELSSRVTSTRALRRALERHLEEKGRAVADWRLPKKPAKEDAERETL